MLKRELSLGEAPAFFGSCPNSISEDHLTDTYIITVDKGSEKLSEYNGNQKNLQFALFLPIEN
ncbi:hypothetical protein B4Q04_00525 [Zobellia sp. OII3]|nr:hypothetical protein B4Q04_00525 [Zobellia sp. OII3]